MGDPVEEGVSGIGQGDFIFFLLFTIAAAEPELLK